MRGLPGLPDRSEAAPPVESDLDSERRATRPVAVTLLAFFFMFGTTMCALTVLTLLFPGSVLEPLWGFKAQERVQLGAMGAWAVLLMSVVGLACALSALGLWRLAEWGRRLAIAVLLMNVLGDTAQAIAGHDPRPLIGIPIGGALIAYLLRTRIRGRFRSNLPDADRDMRNRR